MRISRFWPTVLMLSIMCPRSGIIPSAHAQRLAEDENQGQSNFETRAGQRERVEESRFSENQISDTNSPGFRRHSNRRNQEEPGTASATTHDRKPSGLVVVIEDKPQKELDLRPLKNPLISGVALQIHWRDIEPEQGQPHWTKLDQLFAAAEASNKWVQLLIFPGFFTPDWALKGVKTEQFPLQYGPGSGTVETLPMPWNKLYLDRWCAFLKQLSDRYGTSPAFRLIGAAGPTSVSVEMTLPGMPEGLKKWQKLDYKPAKYLEAWQRIFQAYAADFPNQYVSLSLGLGLGLNDQGKKDPRERSRVRQANVDQAINILGRRFVMQSSDVHTGLGKLGHNSDRGDQYVIGYNGRVVTGFQMRCSAERGSEVMGAQGNPPLALRKSITEAMEPNEAGKHVNYLEIYAPDVVAEEMQPVLSYGASLFEQKQPPERFSRAGRQPKAMF